MAAWLAFLKFPVCFYRLTQGRRPSGEELAAHLAFQLERSAKQYEDVALQLMATLNQFGT